MRRERKQVGLVLRAAVCCWLLYAVARPWSELGGVVDERLRWLHRVVVLLSLGFGWSCRDAPPPEKQPSACGRAAWFTAGAAAAVGVVVLELRGQADATVVVLSAGVALAAGAAASGAWIGSGAAASTEEDSR